MKTRYNWDDGSERRTARVWDGGGNELKSLHATDLDITTGTITVVVHDEEDHVVMDEDGESIKRETIQHMPPLSILFDDGEVVGSVPNAG